MKTLRLCATIGLGLSLAVASGCKGDSTSTKKDAALDTRRTDAPGTFTGPDTASGPCVFNGTTYQPGQSFTVNCTTYTCTGGDNVTSKPAVCSDAGPTPDVARAPDLPSNRDSTSDTRPVEAGAPMDSGSDGGSRDAQPGEAGSVKLDVAGKDTPVPDVFVPQDATPPQPDADVSEDTSPPSPDLSPLQCMSGGTAYRPGDTFTCGCNTCFCSSSGVTQQLTTYVPGDTFACDVLNCNTCLCNSSNAIQRLTNNVCTVDAAN